nr:hypothetical protein [Escherichia coli]
MLRLNGHLLVKTFTTISAPPLYRVLLPHQLLVRALSRSTKPG